MEVQKHPHHVTHKKKWSEYFLEFLMLFLAVFLGFVAENLREKAVEKEREKQYIQSFAEDLEADTVYLQTRYNYYTAKINEMDSLIFLLNNPAKTNSANGIYYFCRRLYRNAPFRTNDRTVVQLRNAGGMRLISNKEVSDSIVAYYALIESTKFIDDVLKNILYNTFPSAADKILDGNEYGKLTDTVNNLVMRPDEILKLRSTDKELMNDIIMVVQRIKIGTLAERLNINIIKDYAKRILKFLQEKYQI